MEELISQLGVDWKILVGQIVNFTILFLVLGKFVYKPVLKLLDERKEQIEQNNKREKQLETKISGIEAVQKNIIAETKEEAEALRAEILLRADEAKEHILAEAQKNAEQLVQAEKSRFENEIKRIEKTIQTEVVELMTKSIEKSLGEVLTPAAQKKLLDSSLERFISEYSARDFDSLAQTNKR